MISRRQPSISRQPLASLRARVTMAPRRAALRSAHCVPGETMQGRANKRLHVEAGGGGEEEPLRQECAWIGRGSFSNGGENSPPTPSSSPSPNVQLALYKMSPGKQSHSCGVSTEAVKV